VIIEKWSRAAERKEEEKVFGLTLIGFLAFPYQNATVIIDSISFFIDLKSIKQHNALRVVIRFSIAGVAVIVVVHLWAFVSLTFNAGWT
jgi:hypothetical protein